MSYKLFLDDLRLPQQVNWVEMPLGPWVIVRSYDEFVKVVKSAGLPSFVSFDHDLSQEHYPVGPITEIDYRKYTEKTGFDCAKWLCEYCMDRRMDFPNYQVHSMNPVGRENIKSYIESYRSARELLHKNT